MGSSPSPPPPQQAGMPQAPQVDPRQIVEMLMRAGMAPERAQQIVMGMMQGQSNGQ